MTSQSSSSNINFPAIKNELRGFAALHTPGMGVSEHKEESQVHQLPQRCSSTSNMNWDPQVCHLETHSNNIPNLNQSNLSGNVSLNSSGGCDIRLKTQKVRSVSSSDNIPPAGIRSTPSSCGLCLDCNNGIASSESQGSAKPHRCDCSSVRFLNMKDPPGGQATSSSPEESFHFSSPYLLDNPTNNLFSSRFSSSLKGGGTMSSCADDSGFGFYEDDSPHNSSQFVSHVASSSECSNSWCQETAVANRRLSKELLEVKLKLDVKEASLARLKDAITQQYVEKEDIVQLKIKSETELRACERQLEISRKSEGHFRENYYQSAAELNALRRDNLLLHGQMTSNKILTTKLDAEKLNKQNNNKHCLRDKVAETTVPAEPLYQELLVPPLEEKVLQLEKELEKLQDDTEDLEFKAQRHEEEAASLCAQNTQLVKKCSDLQRQLVECLSTVDVLDVRCNDAESKLDRARQALEEKENALHALSGEHAESLVKISENEREMDKVRTEMDNVTRNFVKISFNQREFKEDLLFYKNVLKTRDQKIKYLTEDRKRMLLILEELKDKVQGKDRNDAVVQTSFPGKDTFVQTNVSGEVKEQVCGNDAVVQTSFPGKDTFVQTNVSGEVKKQVCGNDAAVQTNFPGKDTFVQTNVSGEVKERVCGNDAIVQTNFPGKDTFVQTNLSGEVKERVCGNDTVVQTNLSGEVKEQVCGNDALVQTNFPGKDTFVQTNFPGKDTFVQTNLSGEVKERVCGNDTVVQTNFAGKDTFVQTNLSGEVKERVCGNNTVVQTNLSGEVKERVCGNDAVVQTIFPEELKGKDTFVQTNLSGEVKERVCDHDAVVQTILPEELKSKNTFVQTNLSGDVKGRVRVNDAVAQTNPPKPKGRRDAAVETIFPEKKIAAVQTVFPEQLPVPWAGQCTQLMESIAVGDDLMAGQVRGLKSENAILASKVESLNNELEERCAAGVFKMTEIMETIEKLENDMNQFLSSMEMDNKTDVVSHTPAEYDMMRELAEMRRKARALGHANEDLEEQLKKQAFWLDAVLEGREAGQQVAREKLADLKMSYQNGISIEPCNMMVGRDVHAENKTTSTQSEAKSNNRLCLQTKAVILENANNELVTYVDTLHKFVAQSSTAEPPVGNYKNWLVFQPVDMLNVPELNFNVFDEVYRISVFLQICLLKTRTIASKEKDNHLYLAIISGLEALLTRVRSAVASNGSLEPSGLPEAEPNVVVASTNELETQLSMYQKNNSMLREVLAVSEEERRKEEKRHKMQLYDLIQKFKLRLKENKIKVSTCNPDPDQDGNQSVQNMSFESGHRVCTDMVINLKRSLRASESANIEVQKQLRAKTEETWKLCQEITNLRSSLEAVNDILDNKKIALGRSEAMGQMLKVSEASLGLRLEQEQRQHEECRQQLDRLAATLQQTRNKNQEIAVLRRQLVEKEQRLDDLCKDYNNAIKEQRILLERFKNKDRKLERMRNEIEEGIKFSMPSTPLTERQEGSGTDSGFASSLLPSPAPMRNRTEILNIIERAKKPRSDIIQLLDDCVSHMSEDMNLLQHHLQEKRSDSSSL